MSEYKTIPYSTHRMPEMISYNDIKNQNYKKQWDMDRHV